MRQLSGSTRLHPWCGAHPDAAEVEDPAGSAGRSRSTHSPHRRAPVGNAFGIFTMSGKLREASGFTNEVAFQEKMLDAGEGRDPPPFEHHDAVAELQR